MGEEERGALSNGRVITTKIAGKPNQREAVDDPFRGVKVVPFRSIAKIARIGMVEIMIPLAETHEGDQPAIATAVLRTVGLGPHHVTERIDGEGGVQHHEHSEEAAQ